MALDTREVCLLENGRVARSVRHSMEECTTMLISPVSTGMLSLLASHPFKVLRTAADAMVLVTSSVGSQTDGEAAMFVLRSSALT